MSEQLDDWTREILREALERLMSDLSEDNWAAGWMLGTEHDLWAVIHDELPPTWGASGWSVDAEDAEKLREISRRLGEWHDGQRPVPLEEWGKQHAAYREAPRWAC